MSLLLLACAAVSDEDELEGGHLGRGVGGGGGGGGGHRPLALSLVADATVVGVIRRFQRWSASCCKSGEKGLLNRGRKELKKAEFEMGAKFCLRWVF